MLGYSSVVTWLIVGVVPCHAGDLHLIFIGSGGIWDFFPSKYFKVVHCQIKALMPLTLKWLISRVLDMFSFSLKYSYLNKALSTYKCSQPACSVKQDILIILCRYRLSSSLYFSCYAQCCSDNR